MDNTENYVVPKIYLLLAFGFIAYANQRFNWITSSCHWSAKTQKLILNKNSKREEWEQKKLISNDTHKRVSIWKKKYFN